MKMSNTTGSFADDLGKLTTYQVGVIESAAHRALRLHKDSLLKGYGITGIEWYVIGTVADSGDGGIRVTDLASMLGTTVGFLTKTINLLTAKGIVARKANADDARSTYVVLDKKYAVTVDEIEKALRAKLRASIYSHVTPEELKTYIKVLDKFRSL
jgi:DNA-binding MarR family transcriptional regulator